MLTAGAKHRETLAFKSPSIYVASVARDWSIEKRSRSTLVSLNVLSQEITETSLTSQFLLPLPRLHPQMPFMMALTITTFPGATLNPVCVWTATGKIYPSDWTT